MSTPAAVGLTIADLEAMPEDIVIRNLIDGELFVTPAPTTRHQRVIVRIILRLADHAGLHGGEVLTAPCAVRLSDRDVPEPDVLFLLDLVRKRRQYERFGIPEYWFVDLDADRVDVYRQADGRYGPPWVLGHDDVVHAATVDGLVVASATS